MSSSTWTPATNLQPPLPPVLHNKVTEGTDEVAVDGNLTFVDFLPDRLDQSKWFKQPQFEIFPFLVRRGNEWLRANPGWEVRTCESVEFKLKSPNVDTQAMAYLEYSKNINWYVRGLRLWIVPRVNSENEFQQIAYMNLVPQIIEKARFLKFPRYESLYDVVERFNTMIGAKPIPGRIINVETQKMKSYGKNVDADCSCWTKSGELGQAYIYVLRIFYEISSSTIEPIGVMDFVPEKIKEGGIISHPQYEPFTNVINKASVWFKQQINARVCNAQALEITLKRGWVTNLQEMSCLEHGKGVNFYVRILRIIYTMKQGTEEIFQANVQRPMIRQLACKTFIPVQLTDGYLIPEFETLDATRNRIEAWIKATGAQVICAETAEIKLFRKWTSTKAEERLENCFSFDRAEMNECWIFVIRLYLNGSCDEPERKLLPDIPTVQKRGCCIS